MKIIGLTGGIGSGKTAIAKLLSFLGAAIYNSDEHARYLMSNEVTLINQIKLALGNKVYSSNNELNRDLLRELVFNDNVKLKELNNIVHSAVRSDFKEWVKLQTEQIIVFESALILTKGWIDLFDFLVYIKADESTRLKRIIDRDQLEEEIIKKIMANQLFDYSLLQDPKIRIIENNGTSLLIPQVWKLYKELKTGKTINSSSFLN